MTQAEKDAIAQDIKQRFPNLSDEDVTLMMSFIDRIHSNAAAHKAASSSGNGSTRAKSERKKKADRLVDSQRPSQTYTIYVSIEDCPVKVFRRIKVPSNLWLGNLSHILIDAIGWEGYHLWQFTEGDVNYTSMANIEDREKNGLYFHCRQVDDMTVTVADVLPRKGSKITFEYDFGDSWTHNVRVSSISDEPCDPFDIQVISGKGACPPEDVGGVWGYARMLDILSGKIDDPKEKASYEEWLGLEKGEKFDAERFDIEWANEDILDIVSLILDGKSLDMD